MRRRWVEVVAEHDLFPYLRLRIPGVGELGFDVEDADLRDLAAEAVVEHAEGVGVTLDRPWLGSLRPPVLAEGDSVVVDGRRLPFDVSEAFG